jgi:flagellar FliJ protein
MSKFRFKLQKVLELRERLEKESATQLAAARQDAELAQQALRHLQDARQQGAEEAGKAAEAPIPAGELQQIALMIAQLEQHLDAAEQAAREADARVLDLVSEFEKCVTNRQVIDKLKERQIANWREDEQRSDQRIMDAVALARYTRKRREGGTP